MTTTAKPLGTARMSWEYLMPQRRKRAAIYVRESDPNLAESVTIDSAEKLCREYVKKENYLLEEIHVYREAVSAKFVPYFNRKELMKMLKAGERGEFDILVITEVRALSRRGAGETFIIYEMLQKSNVSLETAAGDKFADDPTGELVLSFKATYAKLEREQSYLRMQRGKQDRVAIGNAPNACGKPPFGYKFIDTQREVKGAYIFDDDIYFVDANENEWSRHKVVYFIFDLLKKRTPIRTICHILNGLQIPPPKPPRKLEPHWVYGTVRLIAQSPIYIGEVWVNKYKKVDGKVINRPREEWTLLKGIAPAMINKDDFEAIQKQFAINKQDASCNRKYADDLGLLRNGFIRCGICNASMHVSATGPSAKAHYTSPLYRCYKKGAKNGILSNHSTTIHIPTIDKLAWEKVLEIVSHPTWLRERVKELREQNKPPVNVEEVQENIAKIDRSMQNLFTLAANSTNDETMMHLTKRLQDLEQQKREAESLLMDAEEDEETRADLEAEIVKFESWVKAVASLLTDPSYNPLYDEKRLAIRIIGIKVTVYPTKGEHPYRYRVDATVPEVLKRLSSEQYQG